MNITRPLKPKLFNPNETLVGLHIPNFILKRKGLSNLAKLCYGRLTERAGKKAYCSPSQELLAKELVSSISRIQVALRELKEENLLLIVPTRGKNRLQHRPNVYMFIRPAEFDEEVSEEIEEVKDDLNEEESEEIVTRIPDPSKTMGLDTRQNKEMSSPTEDKCLCGVNDGSNNISNNILHYISSSSENKFSSSSIHVISEKPSTNVSGIDTGDFQSVLKQHSTVGKGLQNESHLPPGVINSLLQKDAPCPASNKTSLIDTPVTTPNKGLLNRRVLTRSEKVRSKAIEERLINIPAKIKAKKEEDKKNQKPLQTSAVVRSILDYWVECGFKLPGETTKGIKDSAKKIKGLLNGTLFPQFKQPFTIEQIKLSIIRHQIMAFDNDYEPAELAQKKRLQKLPLSDFIENTWIKNGDKSPFLTCHKYEPKLVKQLLPDPTPTLTKTLKDIFAKEVCAGRKPEKYSTHDENCFRSSVDKIIKFCTSNSRNLAIQTEREMMVYLCDCLRETCSGGTMIITPGFLCSEKTFTYRLPQYLEKQGIMYR